MAAVSADKGGCSGKGGPGVTCFALKDRISCRSEPFELDRRPSDPLPREQPAGPFCCTHEARLVRGVAAAGAGAGADTAYRSPPPLCELKRFRRLWPLRVGELGILRRLSLQAL